jgi:hypothetical protein
MAPSQVSPATKRTTILLAFWAVFQGMTLQMFKDQIQVAPETGKILAKFRAHRGNLPLWALNFASGARTMSYQMPYRRRLRRFLEVELLELAGSGSVSSISSWAISSLTSIAPS